MRRWRGRRCVRRRCGGRRRLAIKADRLVECPKRLEDRRGARLAAHRGWAVDAIADKLAGVTLVAVAPRYGELMPCARQPKPLYFSSS